MTLTATQLDNIAKHVMLRPVSMSTHVASKKDMEDWDALLRDNEETALFELLQRLRAQEWQRINPEPLPQENYNVPIRWTMGNPKYRCICGRITRQSEVVDSVYACPACNGVLYATFPEDRPGPIDHVLGMP